MMFRGGAVYYWRAQQGLDEWQGHWMGLACYWHRATAIKCAEEHVRMASLAEKEMREMMM